MTTRFVAYNKSEYGNCFDVFNTGVNEVPLCLVRRIRQSQGCTMTSFQSQCIGWHYGYYGMQHACCPILNVSVNGASTISSLGFDN